MPSVHEAVVSGDRKATLIALRDRIAKTIDSSESGRDMASLSKRLMEVITEIDALPDQAKKQNPMQRAQAKVNARSKPRDG